MRINLLFGIALLMLISCSKKEYNETIPIVIKNQSEFKSASDSLLWETFTPIKTIVKYVKKKLKSIASTSSNDEDDDTYVYEAPTPSSPEGGGDLGTITYHIIGGVKYRMSFSKIKCTNATCNLKINDKIMVFVKDSIAYRDTIWVSGDFVLECSVKDTNEDASVVLRDLVFEHALPFVTASTQGVTGTVYLSQDCSRSGRPYQMGSAAAPSVYVTKTVHGINYGGNIPFKSISNGSFTIKCEGSGAREEYTPWTAQYAGAIHML